MLNDVGCVFPRIQHTGPTFQKKMSISTKFERLNGQSFLLFYKMDSQIGETVEQTKGTIKNCKKKWTDNEVQDLIELLVDKPCLWDIFCGIIIKALNICLSAMIE